MDDFSMMGGDQFISGYNMGLSKVFRLNGLIVLSHQAANDDNHKGWKTNLDGIYREIWAYIQDKDKLKELTDVKFDCENHLLQYLKWEGSGVNQSLKYHVQQMKQIELEKHLDKYERLLIRAMKDLKLDLPGTQDPRKAVLAARH